MNAYEQIIKTMRQQGATSNPKVPQLAIMTSSNSCDIGDLELEHDDLMVADHLLGHLENGDTVLVQKLSDEKYAIIERLVDL